jgi:hypothetical protein
VRGESLVEDQSSLPVDDEQCVVDADGEADHEAEDGGGGVHLDDVRERVRAADADADADQRGDQRQSGRDQGTQGEHQHEGGDGETDHLADADGDLECLERVARENGHPRSLLGALHYLDDRVDVLIGQ